MEGGSLQGWHEPCESRGSSTESVRGSGCNSLGLLGDGGNAGIIEARLAPPSYSTVRTAASPHSAISSLNQLASKARMNHLSCGWFAVAQLAALRAVASPNQSIMDLLLDH